jgi:hypothetical protein
MFSMGAVLSVLLSLDFVWQQPSRVGKVALDGFAVLLMALTAVVLTRPSYRQDEVFTTKPGLPDGFRKPTVSKTSTVMTVADGRNWHELSEQSSFQGDTAPIQPRR